MRYYVIRCPRGRRGWMVRAESLAAAPQFRSEREALRFAEDTAVDYTLSRGRDAVVLRETEPGVLLEHGRYSCRGSIRPLLRSERAHG